MSIEDDLRNDVIVRVDQVRGARMKRSSSGAVALDDLQAKLRQIRFSTRLLKQR